MQRQPTAFACASSWLQTSRGKRTERGTVPLPRLPLRAPASDLKLNAFLGDARRVRVLVNLTRRRFLGYATRAMTPDPKALDDELAALVSAYRTRCLWFLRPDFMPTSVDEQLRVLGYIQRYGDLEAFRRASALRRWLSPTSSAASAG